MPNPPERNVLSTHIEQALEASGVKTAGMVPPTDAGWVGGINAESSEFHGYSVISPQTASSVDESLGDPTANWRMPYTVTAYGVTRAQVEDLADFTRLEVLRLRKGVLEMRDASKWKLTHVECTAIGGVGLSQNINPHAYSQSDSFVVYLSRNP